MKIDTPTSERVSPFNFLVDPECVDSELKTARFVAEKFVLPTAYVNKIFGVKLNGTSSAMFADGRDMGDKNMFTLQRSEIIELWDKENDRTIYFADELKDRAIGAKDWLWAIDGYPYDTLLFNKDNDHFLPIPDFRQYKHQVFQKMKLQSRLAELFDRLHKIFLADSSIAKKLEDILQGGEARVIPVENINTRLDNLIKEIADFAISPSTFDYIGLLNSNIERLSGLPDYLRGLITEAKRTATELVNISSMQNLRIEERKNIIKKWIIGINRKRLQLLQQNLTIQQAIRITKDEKFQWIALDRSNISGEFFFDLDVTSMAKKNKEVERKQNIDKYQMLRQDPFENPVKLLEDVHKSFDDKDIKSRITPPPPPEPEPEQPKISISLRLEAMDLQNPAIFQLLNTQGIKIQAEPKDMQIGMSPYGANGEIMQSQNTEAMPITAKPDAQMGNTEMGMATQIAKDANAL